MLPRKMSWYWISAQRLQSENEEMDGFIEYALSHGINVFEADPRLTGVLHKYPRDSYYLYSNCDIYDLSDGDIVETWLAKQIEDCTEDYIDICCLSYINEATKQPFFHEDEQIASLLTARNKGIITYAGIFHSGLATDFFSFIDKLHGKIDFCALYINYIDWYSLESSVKAIKMRIDGIPLIAMAPTKSGVLERLSGAASDTIRKLRPDSTPLEWAIDWIMSDNRASHVVIEPSGTLSLRDYLEIYEKNKPLDIDEDCNTLSLADDVKGMPESHYWACINCLHCARECPAELDIGYLMTIYKNLRLQMNDKLIRQYRSIPDYAKASNCIACGNCLELCQERISIPEYLADLERIAAK